MKNTPIFQKDLMSWFRKNQRDLPWRRKRSAYATWVSEMMLQQTQVKTMVPYFIRWMKELPNVDSLEKVSDDKLHKLWQGLGYYARARNLKKGASYIVQNHAGQLPNTYDELLKIPGIGPYSAGAILSLAFNKKAPIVDGNVLRVLSRIYAITDPIDEEKTKRRIYDLQSKLVPSKSPGVFNEALMELGALICAPKNPQCLLCPVSTHCQAAKKGLTDKIPHKRKKIPITKVQAYATVLKRGKKVFIHKRPVGSIMGGLWEFPEWKDKNKNNENQTRMIASELKISSNNIRLIHTIKRHYTRFAETLSVYEVDLKSTPQGLKEKWLNKWVSVDELEKYPFTSAHTKIANKITLSN